MSSLPDDGLRPLALPKPVTRTAMVPVAHPALQPVPLVPAAPVSPPPTPAVTPPATVRHAIYVPGQDPGGVIPAGGPPAVDRRDSPAQASTLSLEVSGPERVAPGQPLPCQIVARNAGIAVLAGVRVEVPLPAGTRLLLSEPAADLPGERLSWHLGNLEAGAARTIKLTLQPGAPGKVHLRPTASFTAAAGLRAAVVRPPFSITVQAPETAVPGAAVAFQIQVANNRDAPAQKVVLHVALPRGLVHPQGDTIEADLGTLAPGEARTIRLEAEAQAAGRLVGEFSARADGGMEAHAPAVVVVAEPALGLRVEGPRRGGIGEIMTFRVEVDNPGRNPSTGIHLTQAVPQGLEFLAASTGGTHNPATGTIAWALDALHGQQRQSVTFQARGRLAGDWAVPCALRAEGMAEARATHAVHLDASPLVGVALTAHDDPVAAGGETTYEMRVLNQGPVVAQNVRVVALLPDTVLPLSSDGPTRSQQQGQVVAFEPVPQLGPRSEVTCRVRIRGVKPGSGRLHVEVQARGLHRPVVQEATVNVRPGPAAARR
jgi:uncharacterized repeat protein (TIGR01451 family)